MNDPLTSLTPVIHKWDDVPTPSHPKNGTPAFFMLRPVSAPRQAWRSVSRSRTRQTPDPCLTPRASYCREPGLEASGYHFRNTTPSVNPSA